MESKSTTTMLPSFFSSMFSLSGQTDASTTKSAGAAPPSSGPDTRKDTDRGVVNAEGITKYAFSGMQGWRASMEDAHMVCTKIPVDGKTHLKGHALFGVMDGHGGDFTSYYASKTFLRIFSKRIELSKYHDLKDSKKLDVPGIELLRIALSETFAALDSDIRDNQNQRNDAVLALKEKAKQGQATHIPFERSGSTCVVVLVTPSHIICANAGDSRSILRRNGKTLPLSFDHKPANIPELERIEKSGGFVKSKRVNGDLAVSRGLGDFTYKSNESMTVEEQKVIPDPEIVCYPRNRQADEFIVLACDGVWDVATNEECSAFVQGLLDEGETDLGLICEEAMDHCLHKNSRDNMTISIVGLDAMRISKALIPHQAVILRRATRQAIAAARGVGFLSMTSEPKKSVAVATA